ncbi:MAG: hypothetical protein VXZ92_10170 [SAR324 cluster bacterium]|nr:hypothetical protein [SAR324 cluster bacterium]
MAANPDDHATRILLAIQHC